MVFVDLYRQSPGYCGPACGVMALSYYGIKIKEDTLAKIMNSDREVGTETPDMVKAFRKLGFKKSFFEDDSNVLRLRELSKRFPVIVESHTPYTYSGHYRLLERVGKEKMIFADPYTFSREKEDIEVFEKLWFDYPGNWDPADNILLREIWSRYRGPKLNNQNLRSIWENVVGLKAPEGIRYGRAIVVRK